MLWLREPDRGWPTRFWFDVPLLLPAGTELEVMTRVDAGAERLRGGTLIGDENRPDSTRGCLRDRAARRQLVECL